MTAAPPTGRRGGQGATGTVAGDHDRLSRLCPAEIERELLAGAFRAMAILDEHRPCDGCKAEAVALRATEVVERFPVSALCMAEHRDVLEAIQNLARRENYWTPALVRDELRRERRSGAIRLLPELVTYSWAPLASISSHARIVRERARQRRELRDARGRAADLLGTAS